MTHFIRDVRNVEAGGNAGRRSRAAAWRRRLTTGMALLALGPATARAELSQGAFFGVIEENDRWSDPLTRHHSDRHYTQGLKVVYMAGYDELTNFPATLNRTIPAFGFSPELSQVGWVIIGQNIYTPTDLSEGDLIPRDRPYAGWLYSGFIFQRRDAAVPGEVSTLESFELDLGLTGKPSLAEPSQRTVHRRWFPENIPHGWEHQIRSEPGLMLRYGRLWRLAPGTGCLAGNLDLIPHLGVSLGNIETFAAGGATLRVGWNLPDDFGVQPIDATAALHGGYDDGGPQWGVHAFGRVEGRAVAHNIFLDGNLFRDSHRVAKEPFVADLSCGVVFQLTRYVQVSYVRILRTEEFDRQKRYDLFGSLILKIAFHF